MLSCAAMAPIAQHRGRDAQLASDPDQRPTAARQQGNRLPLELIRKMTPVLAHSTPFRSRRSLAKVSTNAGQAHRSQIEVEANFDKSGHAGSRIQFAARLPFRHKLNAVAPLIDGKEVGLCTVKSGTATGRLRPIRSSLTSISSPRRTTKSARR